MGKTTAAPGPRVLFVRRSGNPKTGKIAVTYTARNSCPTTCPLYRGACYAESIRIKTPWQSAGRKGVTWSTLCKRIESLEPGALWRHNVAGDLPHIAGFIVPARLSELVRANAGRRGFTYTHHDIGKASNRKAIAEANASGFTINLSADSLADADHKASLGIAPIVVTVTSDAPVVQRTPQGRLVIVCPAQEREKVNCANCRQCANASRTTIIAFRAHGMRSKALNARLAQG